MKILVVGATGQLGTAICQKLPHEKYQLFAMHRDGSNTKSLQDLPNTTLLKADLQDKNSLLNAVKGMDVVICTANSASPRRKEDNFKNVDINGIKDLIEASERSDVKQFIYTSSIEYGSQTNAIPLSNAKRAIEAALQTSSLNYTIIRPCTFMDVYFPFFGTDIPIKNAANATIKRPFKFSANFFEGIKHDIENKGKFNVIGKGDRRHSYICVDDVAEFHIKSIGHSSAEKSIITIGGPEALTPLEIKDIFEKLLDKPLKISSTPPFVIKLMGQVLSLFNPPAGNIMKLNHLSAMNDCIVKDAEDTAATFDVKLTEAEVFLKNAINR